MNKKINQFCYRHPNFGIPNLMRYIVIANVAIWLLQFIRPEIINYLTFSPYQILRGQIWRLVSFVFIPPSTSIIAIISFYFYYIIGNTLEARWGAGQFSIYFFTGVVLTVIYGFILFFITGVSYNLDAKYIFLSMFFSFAALFPDMQVLLFFIIPLKIKWLAWIDAALFLVSFLTTPFPVNLLPLVAMLNFLLFCGGELIGKLKTSTLNHRGNTVSFKREAARVRKQQETSLYEHKCCVCGRTDKEYPGLEFRYCSRCAGYRCFCIDHINNHIHFTE